MLSIGKLTGGADSARYYEQTVATGREDYYSGRGESSGHWVGGGARALGIEGTINEGELQALLVDIRHPISGEALRAVGGTSVQGFDLTFSAPKSVSVLLAVGDEDTRRAVIRGHGAAVLDALGYLEREAVQARRGRGGVRKEHAGGLIAGAYRHRVSRAGDPQLHTHVVAANLAQGSDGRWTALHGAALYAHAKTASYLYQAALREQLGVRLGVEWGQVSKGIAEVQGVPRAVIEHFSQRRAEILEAMAQSGGRSARSAQIAALATRRAKDYGVKESTIYERWQARAVEHGLTPDVLAGVLGHDVEPSRDDLIEAAAALMAGEQGLTAQASTFTRREALQAWAELHPQGASATRIEELTDRWLASDLVVRIDGEHAPVGRHEVIATHQGMRVADVETRYTTPAMLQTERRLISDAETCVGATVAVASPGLVDSAIDARAYLAEEQRDMVRALTTSGDGIQIVLAKAGAGKTTALDAAREAWERSGITVQGTALGSFATNELRDSGIQATTIARLTIQTEKRGLPRGSVLIVDEAGMVGTRTLAVLAEHATRAQAKLVLVGDDKQLPEIDAGGAFRGLAQRLGAIELHDNRRQHDPEDRRILDAHRAGRPDELVASLRRRGRFSVSPDVQQTRDALVADWWDGANREGMDQVAMIAMRRSEVRELNDLARDRMRAAGRLGDRELHIGHRMFAVGDRVVTRTNASRLGVVNGSRGTITAIHPDCSIDVRLDGGDEVSLPEQYVAGWREHTPNLDHGYAITANAIQGGTVQRSYVLASEDVYAEWGYVAASRHRVETRFYVTVPDAPLAEQQQDAANAPDALSGLVRALGLSRAEELAIDIAEHGQVRSMPDEQLHSEAARLRELLTTAPSAAAHALDGLTRDRREVADHLQEARQELAAVELQLDQATRRERPPLRERRDRQVRVVETWKGRLEDIDQRRAQVVARHGDPDAWLADHRDDASRLAAIERELGHRASVHGRERMRTVVVAPPDYVTAELGPRPTDDLHRQRAWDRGARAIESYRQGHGATVPSTEPGIGPRPASIPAQRAYVAARRRVDAVHIELGQARSRIGVDRGPEL